MNQQNNKSNDQHKMMIILYYCYPPTDIPTDQLESHSNFHKSTCAHLNLGGRIRVSHEGINGVLSGSQENLKEYELQLRRELLSLFSTSNDDINLSTESNENNNNEREEEDPTSDWLDMKYCHLRKDVPTEKQLFKSLSVKITREVVSLIEPKDNNNTQSSSRSKGRARCRQRRKQKRKDKQRFEKLLQECNNDGDFIADGDADTLSKELESTNISEVGIALPLKDWEQHKPAIHLSPQEWNEKLLQLSKEKHYEGKHENDTTEPPSEHETTTDHARIPEDAILLDTRNVYETKVGHFAVPNLETFFPNTRKFSSLPNALNTEEAAKALAGKQVFMYCTGKIFLSANVLVSYIITC